MTGIAFFPMLLIVKKLKPFLTRKNFIFLLIAVLLLFALSSSFYFWQKAKTSQNTSEKAAAEVSDLVTKVGKLYELPTNESPTIATVSDKNKLLDQPFFARAQNGDKVLIYTNNKKAILYRPSINKIIEVAPINLSENLQNSPVTPQASPSAQQTGNIVIYNGTKTAGLARREGDLLKSKYSNIEIVSTANAVGDYSQTLVIDLTGQNATFAKTLAQELSGKVGSLPSGETKPAGADILIILGE